MERHSAPGVRRLRLVKRAPPCPQTHLQTPLVPVPRLTDRGHWSPSPDSLTEPTGPRPQTHQQRPLVPVPRLIFRAHCSPSPDSSAEPTGLCPVLSGLFAETDKRNLKLVCKFKGLRTGNKTVLKMKNKQGGVKLPDFRTCY